MSKRILLVLISVVVVVIAGCHQVFGGGWLNGLYGGKAHFAFSLNCAKGVRSDDGLVEDDGIWIWAGEFQYKDKSADVRLHGEFDWIVSTFPSDGEKFNAGKDCNENYQGPGDYDGVVFGDCRTQPGNVPGTFVLTIEDGGLPGPSAGDFFAIETDCTPDGSDYANAGPLGGGNIREVAHH